MIDHTGRDEEIKLESKIWKQPILITQGRRIHLSIFRKKAFFISLPRRDGGLYFQNLKLSTFNFILETKDTFGIYLTRMMDGFNYVLYWNNISLNGQTKI